MTGDPQALSAEDVRRRLRAFCEKYRIRRLEVFGSVARGQASPNSDVDLLVTLDESVPVSTAELLEMAGEAEELVGAPVDFVLRRALEQSPNRYAPSTFSAPPSGSMETDQLGRLRDILEAAKLIASYVADATDAAFRADRQKQDAVIRRIEIIGEAAAHLTEETRQAIPELPFRKMRGMRNIVAHDYANVDLKIVWEVATVQVPQISVVLEKFFARPQ